MNVLSPKAAARGCGEIVSAGAPAGAAAEALALGVRRRRRGCASGGVPAR